MNAQAIVKHINNIYKSNELDRISTCSILEQVAADGKKRKMKNDRDLRITIIGLGNLMEAIFACIAGTIGRDNLVRQVNATNRDRADLRRRRVWRPVSFATS